VILEHLPRKRIRPGNAAAFDLIRKLQEATIETRFEMAVASREIEGAGETFLRARLAVDRETLNSLRSDEVVILRQHPLLCISSRAETRIRKRMREVVSAFHEKNPLLPGIPKEELRTRFLAAVPPDVFSAILDRAVAAQELQIQKDAVAAAGRREGLNAADEQIASRVEQALRKAGLEFPGFEAVAKASGRTADETKKMIYVLVRQGRAIKLTDDYFLDRPLWDDLKSRIRALKGVQKTFSVPDFKERFGVSRKYAIPLLEQLDREGITRRSGNERIII
jgi:selenocysteine-specific elongation factor